MTDYSSASISASIGTAAAEVARQTELVARYQAALMNTFGPPQRIFTGGEGCWVWDADGQRYLDLLGGIAVNTLGHAHPLLVEAIANQLGTLGHISNFFASQPQIALAERLVRLLNIEQPAKVFFTNSGTEAVEAAIKLTRRTGRTKLVSAVGAFHGRSMGALALTWKPAFREPFNPLPGQISFVPYGDASALAAAVDDDTAAVFLEPIQGEAGVITPPDDYLAAARNITRKHSALLVLDEVQTGSGRTGEWFAFQRHGITPDVVTLAKGLGGGFPIGACIGIGVAGDMLGVGQHGSTFGGNPVAATAARTVLDVIEQDDLLSNVRRQGERIRAGVRALGHPLVTEVRGEGLLIGIGLAAPVAADVARAALAAGFMINACTPETIRLAPAFVISPEQVDAFLGALPDALDSTVLEK
jgi:acetylornithine/N-succinyldiaminopimelate aminotransferase